MIKGDEDNVEIKFFEVISVCKIGARNRTRTCTSLPTLAPEASASTNSAIRANQSSKDTEVNNVFQKSYSISTASCELELEIVYLSGTLITISLADSKGEGISFLLIISEYSPPGHCPDESRGSPKTKMDSSQKFAVITLPLAGFSKSSSGISISS